MLVFEGDRSTPGTHALVVGIGRYAHLNGGSGPLAINHYGLAQLTSAARSAHHFAQWLMHEARLPLPLGTCRVMLAPAGEEDDPPEVHSRAVSCKASDFLQEANDWIEDASRSERESTIFYFVGHKLQIPGAEDTLLFEDFGAPRGPAFKGGVSFMNIFHGMGSTPSLAGQVQHYFVDGSRLGIFEGSMDNLWRGATNVFDVRIGNVDRRVGGIFHAAMPGAHAYSHIGGVSLFLEALLKGLRGAAAVNAQGGSGWAVTASSLASWLALDSRARSAKHGVEMQYECSVRGDAIVCTLDHAPPVHVSIALAPPYATDTAQLQVRASDGGVTYAAAFSSPILEFELPAGVYEFEIAVPPASPWKGVRTLEMLVPPRLHRVFDLKA